MENNLILDEKGERLFIQEKLLVRLHHQLLENTRNKYGFKSWDSISTYLNARQKEIQINNEKYYYKINAFTLGISAGNIERAIKGRKGAQRVNEDYEVQYGLLDLMCFAAWNETLVQIICNPQEDWDNAETFYSVVIPKYGQQEIKNIHSKKQSIQEDDNLPATPSKETSKGTTDALAKSVENLTKANRKALNLLAKKEIELDNLRTQTGDQQEKIKALELEIASIKESLNRSEEFIAEQAQEKAELEKSLAAYTEKDALKQQALTAIEQKDYDKADNLLQKATKERFEEVADDFYQIGMVKQLKLEYTEALKYYELAAAIPPYNAIYLNKAAQLCETFGYLDKSIDYLNKAIELDKLKYNEHDPTSRLSSYYNNLGLAWHEKGDLEKATGFFGQALTIALKLYGENSTAVATDYNNLGLLWRDKGNLDKAIAYFEKALNINLKLFGEDYANVAAHCNNLGLAYIDKGNLDKAAAYLQKALAIQLKLFGQKSLEVANCYQNLGSVWSQRGEYDKAIADFEKSLAVQIQCLGEDAPPVAINYNNLGLAWNEKGDFDKATVMLKKALAINLKLYGEKSHTVATRYNNLGLVSSAKGNKDEAISFYEKALAIGKELFGELSPQLADYYNNLSAAYIEKEELDKGIAYMEKALALFIESFGENSAQAATCYNNLGWVWHKKRNFKKTIYYSEKAIAIRLQLYGEAFPLLAHSYCNLALVWEDYGEPAKAIACYEKALASFMKLADQSKEGGLVNNSIGLLCLNMHEPDKALTYFQKSHSVFLALYGAENANTKTAAGNVAFCLKKMGRN